jgi:TRAP-type C4-dicarboxylate transport system substrate-binding protein
MVAAGVLVAVAVAGCTAAGAGAESGDEPGTKAGGSSAVVTLRVATADPPGRPGVAQIEEFARQVDELSDGSIRVEPVLGAADGASGGASGWDQEVARLVSDGEVEMGLVPSRAWASLGVTSLQALTAPFLVADEAVLSTVVSGELVDPLMSGLDAAGVQGLALWSEGLRHPFSFGDALLGPQDYDGVVVRAPAAVTTDAMLAALGAETVDLDGPAFTTAVADGDVDAAESSFAWVTGFPAPTVATGNVAYFPKVNVLVIGEEAAAELGEDRVAVLQEAAAATATWALSQQDREAEAARSYCEAGGTVVLASQAQLDALRDAVAPVYTDLEQDALTADLMEQIEQIPTSPSAITPCAPTSAPVANAAGEPPAIADGVYRYDIPLQYLLDSGISESQARADAGVATVTMQDGVYTEQWRNDVVGAKTCSGTYVVAGDRMFMTWTPDGGCVGAWSARATVTGDTITWSEIQAIPPDPPELTSDWEVYLGVPWRRIGEAAE